MTIYELLADVDEILWNVSDDECQPSALAKIKLARVLMCDIMEAIVRHATERYGLTKEDLLK